MDVPAESARAAFFGDLARARHLGDGERAKYANAAVLAGVQNHLAINSEVGGGREETGVTCDAPHAGGGLVVRFAAQDSVALPPLLARAAEVAFDAAHV